MMTDLEFVNVLREWEINCLLDGRRALFAGKDLLEIGSGAGTQLRTLRSVCKSAVGIESFHRDDRVTDVVDYDGRFIPFHDRSFDVLFSSHVLEHIDQEAAFHAEMRRVLRPEGIAVHIVPSASWRLWASATHYPRLLELLLAKCRTEPSAGVPGGNNASNIGSRWRSRLSYALIQRRHGEHGTWLSEQILFRKSAWKRRVESLGWNVRSAEPFGMFLTGNYLLNERLSFKARRRLAALLGASSFLLITEPLCKAID